MKMAAADVVDAVRAAVHEAKRKKAEKVDAKDENAAPGGYGSRAAVHDFSTPLGAANRYRREGASNVGPYTAEGAIRSYVRSVVEAVLDAGLVSEASGPYDPGRSAWSQASDLVEKYIGFKALTKKLSGKKGVTDPAALAAHIGRKKLGAKEMARRSARGRR